MKSKGAKGRRRALPDASEPAREGQLVRQPSGRVAVRTAEVVYATAAENPIPVPGTWAGNPKAVELPSGLTPVVEFVDPGEYIEGIYLGCRLDVGPNKSAMYDLRVPSGPGKELIVSVWGSTILDGKFRLQNPPTGSRILIQYLGDVATSRGLNPARDWRVLYQAPEPK